MTLFKQFTRQLPKLNLFHSRNQLPVLYRHNSSNKRHRKLTQNLLNMSKSHGPSSTTKDKLRHVRYREHIGGKLPVPGKIELQVIGSGGRGTPRSVILATDHVRYLFNCGEGTQRIATEHKIKLSRLENIFITHNSWDNIGGLLGLALTVEGINVPKITIHGPAMVEQTIRMAKTFAESSNIQIEKREVELGAYEDNAFRIEYVPIHRSKSSLDNNSTTALSTDSLKSITVNNKESITDDEVPAKKMRLSQEELCSAVAYICKPHAGKRRLILEKCVDLNVPVGPLLGILKNEESITLQDGTVVMPDQVLSPAEKPYPIIILECPSVEYLDSLMSNKHLNSLQMKDKEEEQHNLPAELVVHMSPVEVLDHPKYQNWIKRFPSETRHLILNESTSGIANLGLFKIQTMLNLLSPSIFPLLHHQKLSLQKNSLNSTENGQVDETNNQLQLACTNLKYHLRPRKGYNRDQCIYMDNASYVSEAWAIPEFEKQLLHFHTKVNELTKGQDQNLVKYPRILFLGTGSSVPSKRRNVSGILLQTEPDSCILLDCGEGTAGQLYRHYGDEVTDNILCNLKAIFISHMHADHHLGLFGLLRDRAKAMEKNGETPSPVLLLSPIQINRWLHFYAKNIEDIQHLIQLVPLGKILPHQREKQAELYSSILQQLNLVEFVPVEVDHCKNAFGVSLSHSSNWKIVYSGDTMPCERLVNAGKNCDLLIHEATMEDDLEEEAKIKTHSTTSQAINIGMKMNAKFILLNHFSQRYSKIPIISDKFSDKVGISFDNMCLSFCDLPLLPHLNNPLKTLFAEEYAEMEEKILKRTLRKQQQESETSAQEMNFSKQKLTS